MRKGRAILGVSALIVVSALGALLAVLWQLGELTPLKPHYAGDCSSVALAASAEDIRIDHARKLAYLSYLDRRTTLAGGSAAGTIMLLDLNAATIRPRAALTREPADFQPHGMDLFVPPQGAPRRLFVISHPPGGRHTVELFEQTTTGSYAPVETFTDPRLVSPDAIAAVGVRQFYVINDAAGNVGLRRRLLDWVLKRPDSALVYFDGEKTRIVASGFKSATGLAVSADGRQLIVSDTAARQLKIFDRDVESGNVVERETIQLSGAPDNITVDNQGDLWIAAHPKALSLMLHLMKPGVRPPTQIFRLKLNPAAANRLTEIYLEPGDRLSAGSVAAVDDGRMLLGAVAEKRVLDCRSR